VAQAVPEGAAGTERRSTDGAFAPGDGDGPHGGGNEANPPATSSTVAPVAAKMARGDFLEIDLAGGGRVRIHGKAAERILDRLVDDLWPR